jgi:ribosomal protein L40E
MTQEKLNELIKLADKGICLHCGDRVNRDRVRCNFCAGYITIKDKKKIK